MHRHSYFNWLAGSNDKEGTLNERNLSRGVGLSPTIRDFVPFNGTRKTGAILTGRIRNGLLCEMGCYVVLSQKHIEAGSG